MFILEHLPTMFSDNNCVLKQMHLFSEEFAKFYPPHVSIHEHLWTQ